MDSRKIRSNLKTLVAIFLVICLLIACVAQYLFGSVTELYTESIQGRLEERAEQYKKSFLFKTNSDLQALRAMACILEDATDQESEKLLSTLWEAGQTAKFVRLCYFSLAGEGAQVISQDQVIQLSAADETEEMQYAIQQGLEGNSYCSHAFYDPTLGYNTLGYVTPVYSEEKVVGVLTCAVSTESYADILSSVASISDVGAVAVMSSDGKVLASTRTHQNQGFYEVGSSKYLSHNTSEEFLQALSNDEPQFFKFELNGRPLYACIMPMDIHSDKIVIVDTDEGVSQTVSGVVDYAHMIGVLFAGTSIVFVVAVLYINHRHNTQLLQVAYHDLLTGAYNRYKFFQLLEENWKNDVEYTVATINIRKFKYINELFTPARSDQLLKDICQVLKQNMEPNEFFCRDTGDTFLLSLTTLDKKTVCARLEYIFSEIKRCCKSIPQNYPISFYCGCASTTDCSSKNPNEELMNHVMLAFSHAKQSQKPTISFYDAEIHEKDKLQNEIENRMESALQNGEFHMYLQPKMDLTTGKLTGSEALVRWVINGEQTIFPDQFIPVFERNGFCVQLDYYMMEQACKQIRNWLNAGLTPVPISVNQTKLLLYEEDYVERICAITRYYNIPSKYITLEILEGLALENPEQAAIRIDQLHNCGFHISMDDFGTGYASLTTLSQLPIDELKLDRSFLVKACQNTERKRRKILEVVIEVAKRLNITTIAEGIETSDNEQLMREMGCDYGQGYYYSKPIPPEDFTNTFLQ